jgi:hypothetical protein
MEERKGERKGERGRGRERGREGGEREMQSAVTVWEAAELPVEAI